MIVAETNDIDLGVLARGPKGDPGDRGPAGPSPDMRVVSVTKSAPDSNPNVTYTKRDGGYDVSYVLPQGPQGENWKEADKQAILDEVKKELDAKIGDAYTKAKDDVKDAILNGRW